MTALAKRDPSAAHWLAVRLSHVITLRIRVLAKAPLRLRPTDSAVIGPHGLFHRKIFFELSSRFHATDVRGRAFREDQVADGYHEEGFRPTDDEAACGQPLSQIGGSIMVVDLPLKAAAKRREMRDFILDRGIDLRR